MRDAPTARRLARAEALLAHDRAYPGFGVSLAGMDEVGRGALIGDVVVACVIMPPEPLLPWVDDSKKLSPERREQVYEQIMACAVYANVGRASAEEIDRVNILNATKLAMQRAAQAAPATLCLVDAVDGLSLPFATEAIVHGDALSYAIAAASIVAKVTRDRQMRELGQTYPQYGLERSMGYGTAEHMDAIRRYGPCPLHRRSFLGRVLAEQGEPT